MSRQWWVTLGGSMWESRALWLSAGVAFGLAACGSRSGLDGSLDPDGVQLGVDPRPEVMLDPSLPELSPPPPVPEPTGCVDFTRSYTSVPSTVMLLIDQSESMNDPFGDSTRWDVLRDAIVHSENGLLPWLAPTASTGLMMYTSINGYRDGLECPLLTSIDTSFGSAERIRTEYLSTQPLEGGDTPTAESIDAAAQRLIALADGTRKYILLVTDGLPDTCAQPNPQNGLPDAILAAQNAFAQGIIVRTVGVSDGIAPNGLQAMANAGAGKPPWDLRYGRDEGAERPLSASTDPAELADQLKGVIGDVRTCSIDLGTDVGSRRALEGLISLDGVVLAFGARDGWTFIDADTIAIHGSACERILADGEQLQVRFPCEAPPPIR